MENNNNTGTNTGNGYTERYGSAEEMRQDLERVATGAAVAPPVAAAPPKKRKAWPWVLLVLALVALAAGIFWYMNRGDIETPDLTGMTIEEAESELNAVQLGLGDVLYNDNYPAGTEEGTIFDQQPEVGRMLDTSATVDVVVAGAELIEVPDLAEMTEAEAVVALKDAGFELGSTEKEFNDEVDPGLVYDQAPAAKTEAPKGTPITIYVSEGIETVKVPNVVGTSESEATSILEQANLNVGTTQEYSTAPVGQVTAQSPSAGVNVDAGTKVTITISRGEETVAVPNVVGMSEQDATEKLEDDGLNYRVETQEDATKVGKVISQSPTGGTTVSPGDRVTIVVGTAPAGP